jgi:hypothetical protein
MRDCDISVSKIWQFIEMTGCSAKGCTNRAEERSLQARSLGKAYMTSVPPKNILCLIVT